MRKILLGLIILVLTLFLVNVIYKGTNIGTFDIWGIKQISQKNKEIDLKNSELDGLVKNSFPQVVTTLNESSDTLQKTKKQYEEKAILLANNKNYRQVEKYKHEFLLTKIGNYAKDDNIDIKIAIKNSDTPGLYDIDFTVSGKYVDVADYIYDLENDTKLGFKIENFSMSGGGSTSSENGEESSESGVTANFTCKEISIDLKAVTESNTNTNNETKQENSEDGNTIADNTVGDNTVAENTATANNTTGASSTVTNATQNTEDDDTTTGEGSNNDANNEDV